MKMSYRIRPEIAALPVYEPGKPIEQVARECGLRPEAIVKLASNENPLGASPAAIAAIQQHLGGLGLYPDNSGFALVHALGQLHGVETDWITLGAGSNELFYLLCDLFASQGTEVVVGEFAFVTYRIAAMLAGARVVTVPMPRLTHDLDAMRAAVTERTRLVFLPNPNNPTGTALPAADIAAFARSLPEHVIFCYDAAYAEYADDALDVPELIRAGVRIIETRTFSKVHGLAGLRIGYGLSHPELASLLNRVRPPFNTGSLAQAAALAALGDKGWITKSRELNSAGRAQLQAGLKGCGYLVEGEHANFILLKVASAAAFAQQLQRLGVIVRPLQGYGLPEWVRVTIGTNAENDRFLQAAAALAASARADHG